AYWASTLSKAERKLRELKAHGLSALGVSTSDYHQQFIALHKVENALLAAKQVGLRVILKYPYTAQVNNVTEKLHQLFGEALTDVMLETFPVLPHMRAGYRSTETQYVRDPGMPQGTCPCPVVTIREDGRAFTCCTPGGFVPALQLGNIKDNTVQDI